MRLVTSLLFVAATTLSTRAEAALTAVSDFGTNPGALEMFEYIPAGLPSGRPLVVVLHGCTQNAAAMEVAGWNKLADQYQFAVLYPQQRSANQQLSCFTWYAGADIARGGGEAASIVAMVDKEIAGHAIDRQRVFVTGLSSGGAFTAVMLAAYPDRFAAGSIMSGLPYKCATELSAASPCQQMTSASQKTGAQWGDLVRGADSGFSGPWPRVQIWQGTSDYTVYPANADELVEQWTNVWNIDQTADATEMMSTAVRTRFNAGNTVAVERYVVTGMGHAIATGTDSLGECPATTGAFFANEGICSTLRAAEFFGLIGGNGNPDGGGSGGSGDGSDDGGGTDPEVEGDGGCNVGGDAHGALLLAVALVLRRRRSS